MAEVSQEVKDLFHIALSRLGYPIRSVELTQDQMCDYLTLAVGEYQKEIQNFISDSNWMSVFGQVFNDSSELTHSLTMRNLDYSKDYSYWFSKEVGLQQRGPWELKKDFFEIERGRQCYEIPSGREICKVMYCTPSTTKASVFGSIGALDTGIGGGFGQYGNYGNGIGLGGFYIGSAYDTALLATDLKYKNSLIRGDLTYKVTAGPNGTRIVHLLNAPTAINLASGIAIDDNWGWNRFAGHYVWYTYYDTSDEADASECRMLNKENVVISPDQVPFDSMPYELLNEPSKITVRDIFLGECMMALVLIRGKYNGNIKIPNAEATLNTSDLYTQGSELKRNAIEGLKERLKALDPSEQMRKQAEMSEQLNKILSYKPMGIFVK